MIYQHQITEIGTFHLNHCEDYALCVDIGQNRQLLAVMDGCTMGDESYFAATLFGRLLRKIAKQEFYQEYRTGNIPSLELLLKAVLASLFHELKLVKNQLQLERNELLATLLLAITDTTSGEAEVLCIGDGLVCADGKVISFDQNNQPDYLAYHLHKDFSAYYEQLNQRLKFPQVADLSLSTDGILTFADPQGQPASDEQLTAAMHYLLTDQSDLDNQNMFIKKMSHIKQNWKLLPTDDLGVVRLVMT